MNRSTAHVAEQRCLLCSAKDAEVQAEIDVSILRRLYHQSLGVDVSEFLARMDRLSLIRCKECDLRWFSPVVAGNSEFYGQLRNHEWYYTKEKQEFSFAAKEVGPSDHVLDIGCGEANFANHIDPKKYIGLETSPTAVREAKARGVNVLMKTVEEYAEQYPHSADVVCAFQVLEHVENPKSFLAASLRCLRKGGRLILSVPSADSFLSLAVNNILNCPPHHVTWWSDEALRSIARIFGLNPISIFHDVLADEHIDGFINTLVVRGLDGGEHRIRTIDHSFRLRVYCKLASIVQPYLKMGLRYLEMRPRGHSTTIVFTVK